MLREVFLGVDGPWKVKHPLQVTCLSILLPIILLYTSRRIFYFAISPLHSMPMFSFLALTVLDTAAGVWLDRNGIVSSSRSNKGHDYDPSLELMRRCRHAAAAVSTHIFIYGGLRGGKN